MREKFKSIPFPLQKQIISRFAAGLLFVFLFLVILFCFWDVYLFLPCIFFAVFLIVNAILLFYNSYKGNYVCVEGICEHIETTGLRKRIKSITIELAENKLKIMIRHRIKRIAVGDTVVVYLAESTQVYDRDDGYLIGSYYALDIGKGVQK